VVGGGILATTDNPIPHPIQFIIQPQRTNNKQINQQGPRVQRPQRVPAAGRQGREGGGAAAVKESDYCRREESDYCFESQSFLEIESL
jgi:hypothetical protein